MNQRAIIFDIDHTVFAAEQTLHEGVADLLQILRRLGFQLGALSSKDHRAIVRLDEAGIRHLFNSVLCSDHAADAKATGGVNQMLGDMGVEPSHAMLVSHAYTDILLGHETGLAKIIGVSHGASNKESFKNAGAHRVVEDIPSVLDVLE